MPYPNFQISAAGSALITTTTLTAIGNLSFNVVAGGVYRFEADLNYQASATTAVNLVIGVGGTATMTMISYQTAIQTATDGTSNLKSLAALVSTTVAGSGAPSVTGTNFNARMNGLCVVNAAGTFQVQARHTSTSAANIQAGGRFLLEQAA